MQCSREFTGGIFFRCGEVCTPLVAMEASLAWWEWWKEKWACLGLEGRESASADRWRGVEWRAYFCAWGARYWDIKTLRSTATLYHQLSGLRSAMICSASQKEALSVRSISLFLSSISSHRRVFVGVRVQALPPLPRLLINLRYSDSPVVPDVGPGHSRRNFCGWLLGTKSCFF